MTQDEKDLLLKDLCARMPYGVNMATGYGRGLLTSIRINDFDERLGINIDPTLIRMFSIDDVKPYLFPLSDMVKEVVIVEGNRHIATNIDWLNANHLDYRGLIEKGLALDATGLNIY